VIIVVQVVNILLLFAFVMAFIRLIKGPSLPDRVIALDLIAALIFGVIVTNSIANNDQIYLDVAIVLALIAFLGNPKRLRIRFDPIVHLHLPDNRIYTNIHHFTAVADAVKKNGIKDECMFHKKPP